MKLLRLCLLSPLRWLMCLLGFLWFWISFHHAMTLSDKFSILLLYFILSFLLFSKRIKSWYALLMRYKLALVAALVYYQLIIFACAQLFIRSDAAVVFNGAFKQLEPSSISAYLTRNPNNLMLFLYERWFYNLFGFYAIYLLQFLNMVYIHLTAWRLYRSCQQFINQRIADAVFTFYLLTVAFSPYFMAMYTDILVLPILAGQLHYILATYAEPVLDRRKMLALGLLTGLGVAFRPTLLILPMAFFAQLFLKGKWRQIMKISLSFGLGFLLIYGSGTWIKTHQQEVEILEGEGLAKNALTFINLGLTYSGTNQEDMKTGLQAYLPESERENYNNGMFKNEYQIKEIKRRLAEYTLPTFLEHLYEKFSRTVKDGTLGWIYHANTSREKTASESPLYKFTKDNASADWVRRFWIYIDEPDYRFYRYGKQLVWVVFALSLWFAFSIKRPNDVQEMAMLASFGGLLFLMIFEGGKARYLIQFLPQLILCASYGLVKLMDQLTFFE